MTNMLLLSLLTLAAAPEAKRWEFKDTAETDGRKVLFFRIVEFSEKSPRPLDAEDQPGPGARFGLLKVGSKTADAIGLIWLPEKKQLWIDCNGDGRYDKSERLDFAAGKLKADIEVSLSGKDGTKRAKRSATIRKQTTGDSLLWAVRGFTSGAIELNGKQLRAMLVDGDADACFDTSIADRIWIDLDGDGKFDGLTEQFLIGTPVTFGARTFLIKPDSDGLGVQIRERPNERGDIRLTLGKKVAKPEGFSAQLVGEWGELITINDLDRPQPVPVGKYRLYGLTMSLRDDAGRMWSYRFEGEQKYNLEISAKKELRVGLFENVTFDVVVAAPPDGVAPGKPINVTPCLKIASGLELVDCQIGDNQLRFASPEAKVKLLDSGGTVLDQTESGFA